MIEMNASLGSNNEAATWPIQPRTSAARPRRRRELNSFVIARWILDTTIVPITSGLGVSLPGSGSKWVFVTFFSSRSR